MKHPEILVLPVLMFTDYFLTVLGAVGRERKYAQHFRVEHYELNPLWQKSISQKKWFNLKHILLVIAFTLVLVWFFEFGDMPDGFTHVFLGVLLVMFGMIIGRHISNILLFRYVVKHPDQLSGEVTMSHQYGLFLSTSQTLLAMIPLALIAIYSRNDFAFGGFLGTVLFFGVHLRWMRKAKRKASQGKPLTQSTTNLPVEVRGVVEIKE